MKQYLLILIIGILIFNSNCTRQYSCSISDNGVNDGFYNAPPGAGGVCTNTGVCQNYFSETAGSPASTGTLAGDCFHCKYSFLFLDGPLDAENVFCSFQCKQGYTEQEDGSAASYPIKANCQYCISQLMDRYGDCECPVKGEYLIDINSGTCGTKCEPGYVQLRESTQHLVSYTHCLFCNIGLVNNNGICECAQQGQYLTNIRNGKCGNTCDANYTHKSDGSAPNIPSTGHCLNCISTHTNYGGKCYLSCPIGQYYINFNPICGTSCTPGYSDKWFAPPSNPLEDNCGSCLRGLSLSRSGCTCRVLTQYLTSTISEKCGRTCAPGYTHNSDGSAPNSPSTGHCLYCVSATHTMFQGECI